MYKFTKPTIDSIRGLKRLRVFLVLVGVSLLCKLTFILPAMHDSSKPLLSSDAREYNRLAINVIENHIFSADSIPPYQHEHSRPPLYPLFIATLYSIFGKYPILIVLAQLIIGASTVILLFLLALRITASEKLSFIASLLFASSPDASFFSAQLFSETLFSFLLLLALLFYNLCSTQKNTPSSHHRFCSGAFYTNQGGKFISAHLLGSLFNVFIQKRNLKAFNPHTIILGNVLYYFKPMVCT